MDREELMMLWACDDDLFRLFSFGEFEMWHKIAETEVKA